MRKIILIFFLITLISSKKNFLRSEILFQEFDDDIALKKSGSKENPLLISIPKPVIPPRANPVRVNLIPTRVKPIPTRVDSNPVKIKPTLIRVNSIQANIGFPKNMPHVNLIKTIPSTIKIKKL